jgi:hypothetical protein
MSDESVSETMIERIYLHARVVWNKIDAARTGGGLCNVAKVETTRK